VQRRTVYRRLASFGSAALLAATVLWLTPTAALASDGTIVPTQSGLVQSAAPDANGVQSFKGIPYAAAPVGSLRWKPPQFAPPWFGVRSATAYGPSCYATQPPGAPAIPMSEDCLSLNIWMPSPQFGPPKAVMIWVPGGGFQFGTSADPHYDGAQLAARGVVVVSINYRLGVFGFLARPELDSESGGSGAYGLQDQIAAVRWVQRNIPAFGGNPANITVFGNSAGAHSIGLLLASPQAHGLFTKAIVQSGAFWDSQHGSIATHAEALARGNALSGRLGVPSIEGLRAVPAAALAGATAWIPIFDPSLTAFAPSIDGQVLTDTPANVFAQGRQVRVPVLAGYTAAEDVPLFDLWALPHSSPEVFYAAAEAMFGPDRMAEFKTLYPAANADQAATSANQLIGDLVISEQTWELLGSQQKVAPVYGYRFSYRSAYSPVAAHVAEVPFVLGNLFPQYFAPQAPPPNGGDFAFSNTLMSYWTNFAKSSNPNGPGLPTWPRYGGAGSSVLNLTAAPSAIAESDTARQSFIASFRTGGRFPAGWRITGG
jgi:para-nitrobenzyl esterase